MIRVAQMAQTKAPRVEHAFPAFALVILLLSAFMDLADTTIVDIALPSLQHGLGATTSQAQWTVDAYLLGLALLTITGGRLGDIFGRKKLFLTGVACFTVASALSGCAPTIHFLIASRLLQGMSAAIMVPQVLAFIQILFRPEERGTALGAYSAVLGLAAIAGPVLAGVLITGNLFGLTWRPIFLVNVPIGIFTFIVGTRVLSESKSPDALQVDGGGIVLASAALLLLLYPLIEGRALGWPAWTYASIVGALVVAALFVWYESRRTRAGKSPLVSLSLFRFKSFTGGVIAAGALNVALNGFILVFTFITQSGLHYNPLRTALITLPFTITAAAVAALSVMKLAPRFGRKVVLVGLALFAAGLFVTERVLSGGAAGLNLWLLLPALFVVGCGMGLFVSPVIDFALTRVPPRDAGSASGLYNMLQQVSSCIGVALVGTLFFNQLSKTSGYAGYAAGAQLALWVAVGILVVALPFVLLLPRFAHSHQPAEAENITL